MTYTQSTRSFLRSDHIVGTRSRPGACSAVKRIRQRIARKQLQRQAEQEYLKTFYQGAESITKDAVIYKLTEESPRAQALQREESAVALLNQQICEKAAEACDLGQLLVLLQQDAEKLNFLSVITIAVKSAELARQPIPAGESAGAAIPAEQGSTDDTSGDQLQLEGSQHVHPNPLQQKQDHQQQQPPQTTGQVDSQPDHQPHQQQDTSGLQEQILDLLSPLILQHAPAYQAIHFTQAAASFAALGVTATSFWQPFTIACDRKLGALTLPQLTTILTSLAAVGFTPSLNWVEKAYRQAKKHMHRAQPSDLAGILWSWGTLGYTPRDGPLLTLMKDRAYKKMQQQQFSGQQLVQLMHGVARMPRYAPNRRWLLSYARAIEPHIPTLPIGDVVDVLLSLVVLGFRPPDSWTDACLRALWPYLALEPPWHHKQQQDQEQLGGDEGSSCGGLLSRSSDLVAGALPASAAGAKTASAVGARPALRPLSISHLAVLPWCFSRVNTLPPPQWMASFLAHATSRLPEFTGEALVDVLVGLAGLEYVPGGEVLERWGKRAGEVVGRMGGEELGLLARALVELVLPWGGEGEVPDVDGEEEGDEAQFRLLLGQARQGGGEEGVAMAVGPGSREDKGEEKWGLEEFEEWEDEEEGEEEEELGWEDMLAELGSGSDDDDLDDESSSTEEQASGNRWEADIGPEPIKGCSSIPPAAATRAAPASGSISSSFLQEMGARGWAEAGAREMLAALDIQQLLPKMQQRLHQVIRGCSAAEIADVLVLMAVAQGEWYMPPLQQVATVALEAPGVGQGAGKGRLPETVSAGAEVELAEDEGTALMRSTTTPAAAAAVLKPSPKFLASASEQAVALAAAAPAAAVVKLLWALAQLQYKPAPEALHKLLAVLQLKLQQLSSDELSAVAWALSSLRHRPGAQWLRLYMQEARSKWKYMSAQGLVDMLWALACFGVEPEGSWLLGAVEALEGSIGRSGVSKGNAAVVLWALQELGFKPREGSVALLEQLQRVLTC